MYISYVYNHLYMSAQREENTHTYQYINDISFLFVCIYFSYQLNDFCLMHLCKLTLRVFVSVRRVSLFLLFIQALLVYKFQYLIAIEGRKKFLNRVLHILWLHNRRAVTIHTRASLESIVSVHPYSLVLGDMPVILSQ